MPLYDNLHRTSILSVHAQKDKVLQSGIKEYLLCEKCESELSAYENEAARFLRPDPKLSSTRDGDLVCVSGLDYRLIKLFQLSILWRASISKHQMFEKVKLGPHEEAIRKMLVAGAPGDAGTYGCLLFALMRKGDLTKEVIMQPTKKRMTDGTRAYDFVFGGLRWVFPVTAHAPKEMADAMAQLNGSVSVLLTEFRAHDDLMKSFIKMRPKSLK